MKRGASLENVVQQIYSSLLNMRDEGVVVANPVFMVGKSGVRHEIDVYYEFSRAGVRHRVAIECKDWTGPISKGQVQEFESKLRDIGNVVGVVVSRSGFQARAEVFARHHDILPLRLDELPSLTALLGLRLGAVALPDESYVGEPFWLIMEVRNGRVTGSHYGTRDPVSGKGAIPLTFSKIHAQRIFRDAALDDNQWAVRGLPRFALRAFIVALEAYERRSIGATICFLPPGAGPEKAFIGIPVSREDLIRDYYGEPVESAFAHA